MRAFIAVELPEQFRAEVAGVARHLRGTLSGKFSAPTTYHLTLAFLGDIDEHGVRCAMDALDAACADVEPLPLSCEGLGRFGKARDATLWLGLRADERLTALAADVRGELSRQGVAYDEKPFKPHITLARHANVSKGELPALPFPEPAQATRVVLFKSVLSSEGATYHELYSVELSSR